MTLICICHSYETIRFTHGYLILPLHCFVIAVLQTLLPSTILTLAYPTQMIAIVTFIPTYLFTITAIVTVIIEGFQFDMFRLQQNNNAGEEGDHRNKFNTWLWATVLFVAIIAATLITMCIVLMFIYLELVGRGSVINAGPPFIVSIILAVIVTPLYLKVAKRFIFQQDEEEEEEQQQQQ